MAQKMSDYSSKDENIEETIFSLSPISPETESITSFKNNSGKI